MHSCSATDLISTVWRSVEVAQLSSAGGAEVNKDLIRHLHVRHVELTECIEEAITWFDRLHLSGTMGANDPWTDGETDLLKHLVCKHGSKAWTVVAESMQTRNSKQCRRRWKNFIAFPERKDSQWTDREDNVLLEEYDRVGNRWTDIATKLTGRTDNAVKNRWGLLQKRKGCKAAPRLAKEVCIRSACTLRQPVGAINSSSLSLTCGHP